MKTIVTFYSYKGGVGRTMAMANVAVLLAQRGLKVLAVDWDLEAPGLERYFGYFSIEPGRGATAPGRAGLLPLLGESRARPRVHYQPHLSHVYGTIGTSRFELDLLPSGRSEDRGANEYATTLGRFDWERYYAQGGGDFVESLRDQWRRSYDVTLIDSRTGLSDMSGICTIQLPDTVVAMFTANQQSLFGVRDIMRLAQEAQGRLAYDRQHLRVLPLPARFGRDGSTSEAVEWTARVAEALSEFYLDWIPAWATPRSVAQVLRIPHVDAYGFGEKLAVVEADSEESADLIRPYRQLADLLTQDPPDIQTALGIARTAPVSVQTRTPVPAGYRYDLYVSHAAGSVMDDWLVVFVAALRQKAADVAGRDIDIFMDLSQLQSGTLWRTHAEKALLHSKLLLAVITPEALDSEWCRREWATFEQREKNHSSVPLIIPLLLQRPAVMPEWIAQRAAIDATGLTRSSTLFRTGRLPESARRLLAALARQVATAIAGALPFDPSWTVVESVTLTSTHGEREAPASAPSDLALEADATAALLKTDHRPEVLDAARRLVVQLRRTRDFARLIKVGEPLIARAPHDAEVARHYAKALIRVDRPADAVAVLQRTLRESLTTADFAELMGLLGFAHKSMWMAYQDRRSRAARATLQKALEAYRKGYAVAPGEQVFGGINVVALLAASRRMGVNTRGEEKRLARSILEYLDRSRALASNDFWYDSWLAELYLALGEWDRFAEYARRYLASPHLDAFELGSFLRQLTEVWDVDAHAAHVGAVVAEMRAKLLSLPGGSLTMPAARAGSEEAVLGKIVSTGEQSAMKGMQTALERARSVGAIRDIRTHDFLGTCFVVDGDDVGMPGMGRLIVSAAHVAGRHARVPITRVNAWFEAATLADAFALRQEVWSSSELDVVIFRPARDLPLQPLPVAKQLPALDVPQRIYVIGHQEDSALKLAIHDNELLDHEDPPSDAGRADGVVRVHYRAPTEAASAGAPVFNDRWEVIAVHRRGATVRRLNGRDGTYEASEGIWIRSLAAAVRGGKRRRPRRPAGQATL